MKQILKFVLGVCICATMVSCMGANAVRTNWYGGDIVANTNPVPEYSNGLGILYQGGGLFHLRSTPGQIGNAKPTKEGKACSHGILWLIAFGDSSIASAAEQSAISKVASVTHENLAVLGFLYHRHCTVVMGE